MRLKHKKDQLFYKCKNLVIAAPLTLAAIISASLPAQALSFNFSYQTGGTTIDTGTGRTYQASSLSNDQIKGVELAGLIWSSYLQDANVNVNVHFAMTNLATQHTGKLGGATPYIVKMNYDKLKLGLAADGTADISKLPTSSLGVGEYYSVMEQGNNVDNSYYEVMQTTANNKALGNDISGTASGLDLFIQLDDSVNWSYNYANQTIANNKYDFVSVVLHEIGHGLGFTSGIDAQSGNMPLPTNLDMFRYSHQSRDQGAIDYRIGGNKYFSTDGGYNEIGRFSTGTGSGGDGNQASHWKQNGSNYLGIMSPLLQAGDIGEITELDLKAFDYIGWDVNYAAQLNLSALAQTAATNTNNASILERSSDVEGMITASGVYSWDWGGPWQGNQNNNQSQKVPEGSTNAGMLAMLLLATVSFTRRFHRRKVGL
ncbi:MAG: NF038122 family metalloprotease [Mastigocoleus sp. MO_167.B18]|nr:NF038122 family metalloprotease [Mastigocoleus sp. MO_167.B18]